MKLSLSDFSANQYLKYGKTFRETHEAIRACGFKEIDLDVRPEYLEGDLQESATKIAQQLTEIGLSASMAHAPGINPTKKREAAYETSVKALEFCHLIDIPYLVVHPGAIKGNSREEFFECNVAFYKSLMPHAEQLGVKVLAENIGNYNDAYFLWNGKDLRELVERVGHPLMGACWDIGHANHFYARDCNQYESILELGKYLCAVHAHDNCGFLDVSEKPIRMDIHAMPCFGGPASVNWDAIIQALKEIDYRGTFNFEVKSPAESDAENFYRNGELQSRLRIPPLEIWTTFNTGLYQMGRFMLQAYDVWEE